MTPGVANWPPKLDGILFSTFGRIQSHKVQHLVVPGVDRKVFFFSNLDTQSKDLGVDFNFSTNRNAGFGFNILP